MLRNSPNVSSEKPPFLLLPGEWKCRSLQKGTSFVYGQPSVCLVHWKLCSILHVFSPQALDRPCAVSLFHTLFCRLGRYYWKAQEDTCMMAEYRTNRAGWISLDEIRSILDCWPEQISCLMWQNLLVVNVPIHIYLCSLRHFLVLVQAGSWCTRCWKAHVEIAKALMSLGAWHHPAGAELVLGSSGKASLGWYWIPSRQVLNLAVLLYATRKQRFVSQLHDI